MKKTGPYGFDERRLSKWTSEGRGQGRKADYSPWLRITNVPSRGRRHRLRSTVHGRVMHLMSDLERNAVFELEWRGCTDLREQFPLDRERTRRIAAAIGVAHPRDPRTGVDIVMTTDLLRNFGVGRLERTIPYFIKAAADLSGRRVMEKLEIERRYWASLGLKLHILTDVELRDDRFENLRWLRDWYWTDDVAGFDAACWRSLTATALNLIGSMPNATIGEVCRAIGREQGVSLGLALSALRHLAARRRLIFDVALPRPLLSDPISRFGLPATIHALAAAA